MESKPELKNYLKYFIKVLSLPELSGSKSAPIDKKYNREK